MKSNTYKQHAEIAEEQANNEAWSKLISWVKQGRVPEKAETRGKAQKVLLAHSMFDLEVFKMRDGVLMFRMKLTGTGVER